MKTVLPAFNGYVPS